VAQIVKTIGDQSYITITPDSAHESLLDIDPDWVRNLYKQYGALLFRGFDFEVEIFRDFTQTYCSHAAFNDSPGRDTVDHESNIQTVNLGDEAFPLHAELSRTPWRPDVCWFACVTPAEHDGQTYICDGVKIVKEMSPESRAALEQRGFRYTQPSRLPWAQFWLRSEKPSAELLRNPPADCPYTYEIIDQKPYQSFVRPAIHKPMFCEDFAFANFLLFARNLLDTRQFPVFEDGCEIPDKLVAELTEIGDRLREPIPWQENDVVMLDNTRFMHSRDKLPSPSLRYILTYFGYLNFAIPAPEEGPEPRWRKPHGLDGLFHQMTE
jgi:alpha-ketoglutarate-dependent taurine dioxygenase